MIDPNSTGYPTLAVIQYFDLHGEAECRAWDLGHAIFKGMREGTEIPQQALDPLTQAVGGSMATAVARHMRDNHLAAAREFGYAAA